MAPADSLLRGRRAGRAGVWFLPPVLAAGLTVAVLALAPSGIRAPLAGCGALAVLVAAAMAGEAVRRGRVIDALHERLDQGVADAERLARHTVPTTVVRARQAITGADAPEPVIPQLPETGADPRLTEAHRRMLRTVVDAVQDREYQRDSARRAIVNIACRIQAEVHRLQDDLGKMQFRHGSPDVLGDLMHLEHGINVAGRVATSLAVLGGGSPVRQWRKPVSLYDVLRAGSGPIAEYLRVEQHRVVEVAVVGPAVEPMILVLGELLDNATRYSPPSTTVVMNTEEVASGVEVSIEDKGMGLSEEARERAEFLLNQALDGLDLEDLGETARIGLRVAGILAHRYNLRISLRPSTCEGVRAVVFIPHELLTALPMPTYPTGAEPHPAERAARRGVSRDDDAPEYERNAKGLPQRRRQAGVAAARTARLRGEEPEDSPDRPQESGLWMNDFFAGLSDGRAEAGSGTEANRGGINGTVNGTADGETGSGAGGAAGGKADGGPETGGSAHGGPARS